MIRVIIIGVLRLMTLVINLILYPINVILETVVPNIDTAYSTITDFFTTIKSYALFGLSYTGLQPIILQIAAIEFVAIITIPIAVHGLKLIARWWETLV